MPTRYGWLLALAIALAGLGLRLGGALEYWLNADEGIYYYVAHAPAAEARAIIVSNAHPPLHYLLLRAMGSLSESPLALRLPSLIAGCLAILALYGFARRLGGESTGLLAAALLAVSPGAIELSQVARPYMGQVLLLCVGLLFLDRYARAGGARNLAFYTSAMAGAMLLQYGSYVVLGAIGLVLLGLAVTSRLGLRRLRDLALAHVPLAILAAATYFLHVEPRLLGGFLHQQALDGWLDAYFIERPAAAWGAFLGLMEYLAGTQLLGVAVLTFFAGLVACLLTGRILVAALTAATLAVAVVLSAAGLYPFGGTRHAIYAAPLVIATIAYGLVCALTRGRAMAAATLAVLALAGTAGESLGRWLGAAPGRPRPFPELLVPRRELADLERHVVALQRTPGVLLLDLSTVFTLSPVFREFGWHGTWIRRFTWGEREVLIDDSWFMDLGRPDELSDLLSNLERHAPTLSPLILRDLRVVSYREGQPRATRALELLAPDRPRALFSENVETAHYTAFRLDLPAYRQALSSVREQPRRRAR